MEESQWKGWRLGTGPTVWLPVTEANLAAASTNYLTCQRQSPECSSIPGGEQKKWATAQTLLTRREEDSFR